MAECANAFPPYACSLQPTGSPRLGTPHDFIVTALRCLGRRDRMSGISGEPMLAIQGGRNNIILDYSAADFPQEGPSRIGAGFVSGRLFP